MKERICSIVEDVVKKTSKEELMQNATLPDQWDSLQRVEIVFALEEEFDIVLEPEEIAEMNTIQDIVNIIKLKL